MITPPLRLQPFSSVRAESARRSYIFASRLLYCYFDKLRPKPRPFVRQSTKTENEGRELDTQGRAAAGRERERAPRKEDTRNTKNSLLDPIRHRKRRRRRRRGSSQDGNGVSVRSLSRLRRKMFVITSVRDLSRSHARGGGSLS